MYSCEFKNFPTNQVSEGKKKQDKDFLNLKFKCLYYTQKINWYQNNFKNLSFLKS